MKNLFPIILISVFIFSRCSEPVEIPIEKQYETFHVKSGALKIEDSVIAIAQGENTSDLSFKTSGKISEILVKPGQTVKAWQVLARLSNRESNIQSSWLERILKNLDAMKSATQDMQLNTKKMQKSISNTYDERIIQAQILLKNLETELSKSEQDTWNQKESLNTNYHLQLSAFLKLSDTLLYESDRILGITTNFQYANDWWEPYLWVRIWSAKVDADNAWGRLYEIRGKLRNKDSIKINTENANTEIWLIQEWYRLVEDLNSTMSTMLEWSTAWWWLSQEMINNWVSMWSGLKWDEQLHQNTFISWKDGVRNLFSSGSESSIASMNIDSIKNQITGAKKNIDAIIAEKESKLREVDIKWNELNGKQNELDEKISETLLSQLLANESIENNTLTAPFDGIILEKTMDKGSVIWAWVPLLKISSTHNALLKTYIDNTQYAYMVGSELSLTRIDTEESLSGSISLIQKEKDPIHNKNYTEIRLHNFSGSTGERVLVHLSRKKVALQNGSIIPLSWIITRYGPPWVFIVKDGVTHFILTQVLASDMNFAEVLWIPENAEIITEWKENIVDWEILKSKEK